METKKLGKTEKRMHIQPTEVMRLFKIMTEAHSGATLEIRKHHATWLFKVAIAALVMTERIAGDELGVKLADYANISADEADISLKMAEAASDLFGQMEPILKALKAIEDPAPVKTVN